MRIAAVNDFSLVAAEGRLAPAQRQQRLQAAVNPPRDGFGVLALLGPRPIGLRAVDPAAVVSLGRVGPVGIVIQGGDLVA